MKRPDAITEDDLHAYVDGLLSDDDRAAVEAWLAERPEEQARVEEWRKQADILRNAFASYAAAHPHDASMLSPQKRERAWRVKPVLLQTAAALLIFVAGAAAGRLLPPSFSTPQDVTLASLTTDIPAQAKSAYLIYASEVRHPVEVGAVIGNEFDCCSELLSDRGHQIDVEAAVVGHSVERRIGKRRADSQGLHVHILQQPPNVGYPHAPRLERSSVARNSSIWSRA